MKYIISELIIHGMMSVSMPGCLLGYMRYMNVYMLVARTTNPGSYELASALRKTLDPLCQLYCGLLIVHLEDLRPSGLQDTLAAARIAIGQSPSAEPIGSVTVAALRDTSPTLTLRDRNQVILIAVGCGLRAGCSASDLNQVPQQHPVFA